MMLAEISPTVVAAQWALLIGLGALVIVMYRQLAYLLQVGRAMGGAGGLQVGDKAPEFEYVTPTSLLTDEDWEKRAFSPGGDPAVLMFTHPGCGSCEIAVENLRRALGKSPARVRALVVTDTELPTLRTSGIRVDAPIELARVDEKVMKSLYRTYRTPYVYGIDRGGQVRARGGGATTGEMRGVLRTIVRDGGGENGGRGLS
jgi:hypothetical protein